MANAGPCINLSETKEEVASKIATYVRKFQGDPSLVVELTGEGLLVVSPTRGQIVHYGFLNQREVYGRLSHVGLTFADMALVAAILKGGEA